MKKRYACSVIGKNTYYVKKESFQIPFSCRVYKIALPPFMVKQVFYPSCFSSLTSFPSALRITTVPIGSSRKGIISGS